jgi:hypothetical protein
MTNEQLLEELDKTAYAELRESRNDTAIAALLNATSDDYDVYTVLTRASMLKAVVGLSAYPDLVAARDTSGPLQSLAYGFLLMLNDPNSEVDFADADLRTMATSLNSVKANLGTALLAMGTRKGSFVESIDGRGATISVSEISNALNR